MNEALTDEDNALTVRGLGGTFGAEITGVDLSGPIEPDTVQTLEEAFLEHYISAIRNQHLTVEQTLAHSKSKGGLGGGSHTALHQETFIGQLWAFGARENLI